MLRLLPPVILTALALIPQIAWGQGQTSTPTKPAAPKANPAYEQIEDQAGLPRVLLLGDSISIGYTLGVRAALEGKANVHRPPTNCASTRTGVAGLEQWLGDKPWDVIHFNFGLHDLKHVLGDSEALVAVGTPGAKRQVPLDEYAANLEQIVERLAATGAKLIWCSTTPVPAGASGRRPEDVAVYNAAALRIMQQWKIEVDDLHEFAAPRLKEIQQQRNVHFTSDGSQALASHVASSILAQLKP